jgi:hypothetical protein
MWLRSVNLTEATKVQHTNFTLSRSNSNVMSADVHRRDVVASEPYPRRTHLSPRLQIPLLDYTAPLWLEFCGVQMLAIGGEAAVTEEGTLGGGYLEDTLFWSPPSVHFVYLTYGSACHCDLNTAYW